MELDGTGQSILADWREYGSVCSALNMVRTAGTRSMGRFLIYPIEDCLPRHVPAKSITQDCRTVVSRYTYGQFGESFDSGNKALLVQHHLYLWV